MAQVTNVKLLDDLDGTKAVETVSFGVDGVGYEIDLNAKNAKALRKALAEFVGAGRHVKATAPASVPGPLPGQSPAARMPPPFGNGPMSPVFRCRFEVGFRQMSGPVPRGHRRSRRASPGRSGVGAGR